jgi:hypothetical protein
MEWESREAREPRSVGVGHAGLSDSPMHRRPEAPMF